MAINTIKQVAGGRKLEKLASRSCGQYHMALASLQKDVQRKAAGSLVGRRRSIEKLWRSIFSEPDQWLDNRAEKVNPKYPDFKHKSTQDALWVIDRLNPQWVDAALGAMLPGTLQVDIFTWNRRLAKLAKGGKYEDAFKLFSKMQREGICPNSRTFLPLLNACSGLRTLQEGRHIHALIRESGYESDVYVRNCLVDMYAKCGSMEDARMLFNDTQLRDVVTWNSMILGYVNCGLGKEALELSWQMQQEGIVPDRVTFLSLLNACAISNALDEGRRVHRQICEGGFEADDHVASSLINMYTKCESVEDAWEVFEKIPARDIVLWNTMILGFVKCGLGTKALELSRQMQAENVQPDPITFVGILNACAIVAALGEGRRVHNLIIHNGCQSDVYVGSSLIDMYCKCGSIEDAIEMFDKMPFRNVVAWNAMLAGYAMHGHAKGALKHFEQMSQEGVEVDMISFGSLLSACSHGGLVEDALHYLEAMTTIYCMSPAVEHYACVIDLLGRAGRLHEAEDLIKKMSCEPNDRVWTALLGACRVHGNVEIGELAAQEVLEMVPDNAYGYVLLSQIYAAAGNWDKSAIVQRNRLQRGVKKMD